MRGRGSFVVLVLICLLLAGALPPTAAAAESTLEGALEVIHADDFETGRTFHEYLLRGGGGEVTQLLFDDTGPHGLGAHRVRVTGRVVRPGVMHVGRSSAVTDLGTTEDPNAQTAEASTAEAHRRVAVILMEFTDKAFVTEPEPASSAESLVFGATSVDSYMAENSFGMLGLSPTATPDSDGVYGPLPIQFSSTGPCEYTKWGEAGRTAAGLADADYDNVIHVLPRNDNCGWSGLAYMPGRYSWVLTNSFDTTSTSPYTGATTAERFRGVASHEFGHNLGIHHAGSWRCTADDGSVTTISGSCTLREYGDPFSVMGQASLERHVNAYQKARLGWLSGTQVATAPAGATTTFVLTPLEAPTDLATVRIPRAYTRKGTVADYYYVEYREPSGFDSNEAPKPAVAGVTIRVAPDPATNAVSKLLDLSTGTTEGYHAGFDDPALAPGKTFTDGAVTVSLAATDQAGKATVTVTVPAGGRTKPGNGPSRK